MARIFDTTLRRDDLVAGRRGDRLVVGRSDGTGHRPISLTSDDARWLALVAFPTLGIAPVLTTAGARTPGRDHREEAEADSPIQEPSSALAPTPPTAPALF